MEVNDELHAPAVLPQGKSAWYPLDRRLCGSQSRFGRGGKDKNSQPRRESNPPTPIVQPVASRFTDWAITALTLLFFKVHKRPLPQYASVTWCSVKAQGQLYLLRKVCGLCMNRWQGRTCQEHRTQTHEIVIRNVKQATRTFIVLNYINKHGGTAARGHRYVSSAVIPVVVLGGKVTSAVPNGTVGRSTLCNISRWDSLLK
jgi:hypothetical protein